jgi:hypothetical protein
VNEREAFAAAKEIGTDAAWDAFLTRFPEGFYADKRVPPARSSLAEVNPIRFRHPWSLRRLRR